MTPGLHHPEGKAKPYLTGGGERGYSFYVDQGKKHKYSYGIMHNSERAVCGGDTKQPDPNQYNHMTGTCINEGTTHIHNGEITKRSQVCPPLHGFRHILVP